MNIKDLKICGFIISLLIVYIIGVHDGIEESKNKPLEPKEVIKLLRDGGYGITHQNNLTNKIILVS